VGAYQGSIQGLQPPRLLEDTIDGWANVLHVRIHLFPHLARGVDSVLLSPRITVMVNFLASLMVFFPIHPAYHTLLTIPSATLTSILTCRVYRRTRLGVIRGPTDLDLTLPTLNPPRPSGNPTVPLSVVQFRTESSSGVRSGDGSDSLANKSETLGTPTKANTLSLSSGAPHDTNTGSAH
jgi:hypothetical protein